VITEITVLKNPIPLGTPVTLTGSFTDPDEDDVHAATWQWDRDDPSTTPGTVTELTSTTGEVVDVHTYDAPGVYEVVLRVADPADAVAELTYQYVVVYDPNGGFVTGGGWIMSPPGAYVADPSLTGRATFGFTSQYKKGANLPTGNTEFQFKAGDLNFKSTAYQWLVVAGARAQFKGWGTINGDGKYAFILTAIDGQVAGGGGADRFRIKIWDEASGTKIYDNQQGTDDSAGLTEDGTLVQGGSIVIQKGK
jgi:PKD repeat protein